jgi:hypothetical protein
MNQTKRLMIYLLVNVIVSACTIISILWLWDRPDKPLQGLLSGQQVTVIPTIGPVSIATSSIDSSILPTETAKPVLYPKGSISIKNIIGAGSATSEVVIIQREGEGELSMANWKLEDSNGNIFVFPDLTLYNGAINIRTTAGLNTVIDLYWNKSESVWQIGETATLIDPLGNIQATYKIP